MARQNDLASANDAFSQSIGRPASSTWQDCEAGVSIEQFTAVIFNSGDKFFKKHALFYPYTGIVELSLDSTEKKHLIPGQGVFLQANKNQSLVAKMNCSFLVIFFPEEFLYGLGDTAPRRPVWQSQIIANDVYLNGIIQLLDKEVALRDHHSDSAIKLLTQYVGIHLIRNYSTIKTQGVHEVGRPEICQVMCVLEYIEINLSADTSIAELIAQTNLSKHRFLQTFKEVTGQSPQQYIIVRRLEVARHLLRRPDLSLEQIARDSGFVDQSHFSKAFRKRYGQTPALFRKQ